MKVAELKKHLASSSKEDLIKQAIELFQKNNFVKDYYNLKYDPEEKLALLDKYKKAVTNEFFPKRGFGKARLSVAKKSISEFKKLAPDSKQIIEIMLHYVEMGVDFTNTYGDIDDNFYMSMEGMYEQVVQLIVKEERVDEFYDRCYDVVTNTSDIGWGFHDALSSIFYECFGNEND